MDVENLPKAFKQLLSERCIDANDVVETQDGFLLIYKSLSDIFSVKEIFAFPGSDGERLACDKFFDDWFIYAVSRGQDYTYGLLKFREQEHDAEGDSPADGDTPGVTVSFISFAWEILIDCLKNSNEENRKHLNREINRVVAYRGQRHHPALKGYFVNPKSEGSYLVASLYTKYIAQFAKNGCLEIPAAYKEILRRYQLTGKSKFARLPRFVESMNQEAGYVLCDERGIYIQNPAQLTQWERAVILATHTGNTSIYSFAAEVEYHARFLVSLARIRIPFLGGSIYDSAIRADMTVGDTEFSGPAPFYRSESRIVRRQRSLHEDL